MSLFTLRNSTEIGENKPPYIVAEINTSHNGDIEVAKKMIEAAKNAGCNCVKFQSWSVGSINSKSYYNENPIAKRFFTKFSLSEDELIEIAHFSKDCGIDFSSTPYSKQEVDFLLNQCEAPYIKVASMDLNNIPYLEYIAKTGAPIMLSTGMGEMDEIRTAVKTIEDAGNTNLCLYHCISIYPPEISTIRLKNIIGLSEEFPNYPIGFSDHSLGIEMAPAAIALGASFIEKHFTLNKSKIGMDNQMAVEPDEMAQLVRNCHNVHSALGGKERIVLDAEREQQAQMRRSVIASKDLKAGTKLTWNDLDVKRPGNGIPPTKLKNLIGKNIVCDIEKDTIIKESDIK
jgi:sialic acid synthase SpsE